MVEEGKVFEDLWLAIQDFPSVAGNYDYVALSTDRAFGAALDQQFSEMGEWVLREGTAPTPEPGTVVLFAVGAGVVILCRKRMEGN